MKKILMSVAVIGFVGAIAAGATGAFFNDTETSTGNFITAGALDLKLNGGDDPIQAVVALPDLKPSQTFWTGPIKLTLHNNPGKLFKKIVVNGNSCSTVDVTEPECTDQHGVWNNSNNSCVFPAGAVDENNLAKVTWFDLEKWVGPSTPPATSADPLNVTCDGDVTKDCWKIGIPDMAKDAQGNDITVASLSGHPIYLGTYGDPLRDTTIWIRQSFHVKTDTGNAYQTDSCTFNEEFSVEQTNAPMLNGAFGIMLRESPTKQSFFDVFTEMTQNSFFDVFTEI